MVAPIDVAALRPWLNGETASDGLRGSGHRGGVPVSRIVKGLLAQGVGLTVVSVDSRVQRPATLAGDQLRLVLVPSRTRHRTRDAFALERANLSQAILREEPDLIHAHWTYEYALAALSTPFPTLVSVRDWSPLILRMKPDAYRFMQFGMNAVTLARARYLAAPSPYLQQKIERWTRNSVAVLPNGIDDDLFVLHDGAEESKAMPPTFVAVNNGFGRRKNVTSLLRAHAIVRRSHRTARLRLVGYQYGQGQEAHSWARQHGASEGVEFLGEIDNVAVRQLMRQSTALVHPSLEESFGAVLIEMMALGRPVIGGRRSGAVPWVLDGGRAGLLTDVRNPRELAGAMIDVLEHRQLRRNLGESGRDHAWKHFRASQAAKRHLDLYDRLLTAGAEGP